MAYGGVFSSKQDLKGNRQALQVGRDIKPLTGAQKAWADFAGMNEDGSWNDWGKARTQILSWFTGNAPIESFQNAQRNEIMKSRNDDYGRAYREHGSQLIGDSQNAMWSRDIEGGLATAEIIGTAATMGGSSAMSAGVDEGKNAAGNPLASTGGSNVSPVPLIDNYVQPPFAVNQGGANGGGSSALPGTEGASGGRIGQSNPYALNDDDRKTLAERQAWMSSLDKAVTGLSSVKDPMDFSHSVRQRNSQNQFANDQLAQNMGDVADKQAGFAWTDSVPMIGDFASSIAQQDINNDIWKATMEDYLNRLDRSLMLDESEYAA